MSLFNCISLVSLSQSFSTNVKLEEPNMYCSYLSTTKNSIINIKFLRIKSNFDKKSNNYQLLLAAESAYRFTKISVNEHNLFQKLINKYWQQTIFLSDSTSLSKKYINNLAQKDTLTIKNQNKKNLIDFSKALMSSRVNTQAFFDSDNRLSSCIQYIWRKGYNIKLSRLWNKWYCNNKKNNLFYKKQINLINILKCNSFPLFVIANNFNQMVIAEPGEELVIHSNLIDTISQWYYDYSTHKYSNKIYEGWFFVNPHDAIEYKNYIESKYIRSSKQNGLKMIATGIDLYYKLSRQTNSQIHFRLLPDLIEISKLVKHKAYRKNLIFHPKQKHGKYYFQGQPIYLIQAKNNLASQKNSAQTIDYFYSMPNNSLSRQYSPVFFSKEVALLAWSNFRKQMPLLNLPQRPILIVYNLEDFLKDHENNINTRFSNKRLLLVPGQEGYKEINKNSTVLINQNMLQHVYSYFHPYLLKGHLWTKRAIWSLTSKQPPS
jgi:hypothetical protein